MIDAHALIDPQAELDSNVDVGPYSIIGAKVQIAAGTWIGPHVVIKGPTRIGSDNKIPIMPATLPPEIFPLIRKIPYNC